MFRPALARLARLHEQVHTPIAGLEPVYTTPELAAHLGVPVQAIHDLRHSGRGQRGFRVGRELRYHLSEVQAWLAHLLEHTDDVSQPQNGGNRVSGQERMRTLRVAIVG